MLCRFIFLVILCLFPFWSVHGERPGVIENSDVAVHYDEPLRNAAMEVVRLYPRVKKDLEEIIGWKIEFKPAIVLIKEDAHFRALIPNPHIIAVAVPAQHLIAIDYSKMNITPFTLEITLKHEMCHIFLGSNISDDRLPRWLNEGFCQWVTGGVAELMIDNKHPTLSKASLSRRLIPLSSLSANFPGDKDQLILAYEESKSIVDYMVTEYGRARVVSILGHLRDGDTMNTATSKVLSVTPEELERLWVLNLQGQVTWIGYLAANAYTLLLFAAALLTICGFVRVIIRRHHRASRADEDEE